MMCKGEQRLGGWRMLGMQERMEVMHSDIVREVSSERLESGYLFTGHRSDCLEAELVSGSVTI